MFCFFMWGGTKKTRELWRLEIRDGRSGRRRRRSYAAFVAFPLLPVAAARAQAPQIAFTAIGTIAQEPSSNVEAPAWFT